MGESVDSHLVRLAQYPKDNIATLGYKMISIVGNKFRDGFLSNPTVPSKESPKSKLRLHQHKDGGKASDQTSSSVIELPEFTLEDLSYHDSPHDCWVSIYDKVYDITSFLQEHPGGDDVMLEHAGRDATLAFRSVGHSKLAENALKTYLVGILVEDERIWTRFFNIDAYSRS